MKIMSSEAYWRFLGQQTPWSVLHSWVDGQPALFWHRCASSPIFSGVPRSHCTKIFQKYLFIQMNLRFFLENTSVGEPNQTNIESKTVHIHAAKESCWNFHQLPYKWNLCIFQRLDHNRTLNENPIQPPYCFLSLNSFTKFRNTTMLKATIKS